MPFLKGTNRGCRFQNLTGRVFGRLTVIRLDRIEGGAWWLCKCECGMELAVRAGNLKQKTRSCGCAKFRKCRQGIARRKNHGLSQSAEHVIWASMMQRCLDERSKSYERYGGRGIKVCDRWLMFDNFLADMGPRPSSEYSIDRINNDGDYEPGNCRWATRMEQACNTRRNRILEFNGESLTLAEWERRLGSKKNVLARRLDGLGWSVEKALTTPIRPMKSFTRGVH